jgi:hypothetical protein
MVYKRRKRKREEDRASRCEKATERNNLKDICVDYGCRRWQTDDSKVINADDMMYGLRLGWIEGYKSV